MAPADGLDGLLSGRSLFQELLRGLSELGGSVGSSVGVIGEAGRVTMLLDGEVGANVEDKKSVLPCSWRAWRSREASSGGMANRRPEETCSTFAAPATAAAERRLPSFFKSKTETSRSGASPIQASRSPSSGP
jgi:hypothetical protein